MQQQQQQQQPPQRCHRDVSNSYQAEAEWSVKRFSSSPDNGLKNINKHGGSGSSSSRDRMANCRSQRHSATIAVLRRSHAHMACGATPQPELQIMSMWLSRSDLFFAFLCAIKQPPCVLHAI
jgi:hypothetical protein